MDKRVQIYSLVIFGLLLMPDWTAQAEERLDMTKRWVIQYDSQRFLDMANIQVTQADIDAYLLRMPPERRASFLASGERLGEALTNIVLAQAFRPLAEQEGLLDDPVTQARLYNVVARETRAIYREWFVESIELDDYSEVARELYLADPERFRQSGTVNFHHLLIRAGQRRREVEAMARALDAHEQLTSGVAFAEVAEEFSDDPSVRENGGFFEGVKPSELLQEVAAILAQTEAGEISAPIRSSQGWHIVRLEAVHDGMIPKWDDVQDRAIRIARERHHTQAFERLLRALQDDGYEFAEGSVAALWSRYGVVDEDHQSTEDSLMRLLIED